MKSILLNLILLISPAINGLSQSFSISDYRGPVSNGSTITISGPPDTLQLITWLQVTNISASTLRIHLKKEEISMLPGAVSSICWAGYCYGPEMTVSNYPLLMLPSQSDTGCFSHYGPAGNIGTSIVRWTYFNEASPDDSLSFTVNYATYPAAAGEIAGEPPLISIAGPVPATDLITVRHSLPPGSQGRIELRNSSGKIVGVSKPVSLFGQIAFNVSPMPSGMYFCTLLVDGKHILTRKAYVHH